MGTKRGKLTSSTLIVGINPKTVSTTVFVTLCKIVVYHGHTSKTYFIASVIKHDVATGLNKTLIKCIN